MEDLMEPEPLRRRVRSFDPVDHGARDIAHTAEDDEETDGEVRRPDLGDVSDSGDPEPDVDGDEEPPRRGGEDRAEGDAECGCAPQHGQQEDRLIGAEHQDGQRCVRAGGDEEDVRMVEPPQDQTDAGAPATPVIDGGGAEEQHAGDGEDRGGDARFDRRGDDHQRQAADHRHGECPGVEPATQLRLDLTGQFRQLGPQGRAATGDAVVIGGRSIVRTCGTDRPGAVGNDWRGIGGRSIHDSIVASGPEASFSIVG